MFFTPEASFLVMIFPAQAHMPVWAKSKGLTPPQDTQYITCSIVKHNYGIAGTDTRIQILSWPPDFEAKVFSTPQPQGGETTKGT